MAALVEYIPTNANNCRLHSKLERIGNPGLKAAIKCVHEYNTYGKPHAHIALGTNTKQ
jgi:hypothetical protein